MARKEATNIDTVKSISAQKLFTDREEPQKSFQRALDNLHNRDYSILSFYGVGGIGKSSLQKHLKEEHLDKGDNNIYSWVDFDKETNRQPHEAFRILADRFKSKLRVPFISFDIAYTIYLSKTNPNMEIKKESLPFLEEGGLISGAIGLVEEVGGIAGFALNIIEYVAKKVQDVSFNKAVQAELKNLRTLEADDIEEELVKFFAHDIKIYKEKNPNKKIVIFLDTYEALWKNDKNEANLLKKDAWIRDGLVTELKQVLFIICGREKIKWEVDDSSWVDKDSDGIADLEQHTIGDLSQEDCKYFLNSCEITDPQIQDKIIASSEGVPYYLDLCVDTFFQIKNSGEAPTVNDFSDVDKYEIFERFMRYLDKEVATLKILANTRFYTNELFKLIIKEFNTGYPATEINQFNAFSFIRTENNDFMIHDLMRKSLIGSQTDENKDSVNNFLFEYYDSKLQNIDIRNIPEDIITFFLEAFYHKYNLVNIEAFLIWFNNRYDLVYKCGYSKILIIKLKELIAEEFPEEYKFNLYYKYGNLLAGAGNFDEALAQYKYVIDNSDNFEDISKARIESAYTVSLQGHYKTALAIFDNMFKEGMHNKLNNDIKVSLYKHYSYTLHKLNYFISADKNLRLGLKYSDGTNESNTSKILNSIGYNLRYLNRSEEAVEFIEKSMLIRENYLAKYHVRMAESYNGYGAVHRDLLNQDLSFEYLEKSHHIRLKILGDDHPDLSTSFATYANYYFTFKDYSKCLEFNQKALEIKEKAYKSNPSHFYISENYQVRANCLSKMGDYDNAKEAYSIALESRLKTYDEYSLSVANLYLNMAQFYHLHKESQQCIDYLNKSCNIFKSLYDTNKEENQYFLFVILSIIKNSTITKLDDNQKALLSQVSINQISIMNNIDLSTDNIFKF